jgi:hypothetical protein
VEGQASPGLLFLSFPEPGDRQWYVCSNRLITFEIDLVIGMILGAGTELMAVRETFHFRTFHFFFSLLFRKPDLLSLFSTRGHTRPSPNQLQKKLAD